MKATRKIPPRKDGLEIKSSKIADFLRPPILEEEEETRIARMVHLFSLLITLGVVLTAIHIVTYRQWKTFGIVATGEAGIIFSFWLCHHRRLVLSTRVLVLTLLATATTLICQAGQGVHDVAILIYPSALVLASQILTRRSFVVCVLVMILSVSGLVTAEIKGILVTRWSMLTRWSDLVDISIILLITSVVVEIVADTLRKSLFRSHRSEANYAELFNATSEAIIFHDTATGKILDVNDATLKLFGYSREEMLQQKTNELSLGKCPYSSEEIKHWIQQTSENRPQILEWLCDRKNGEFFWVELSLKSTNIGGAGRVMVVMRDISKRKEFEKQLHESQQMLRSVMDTIPVRVYWKDKNLNYLGCNRSFAVDTGISSPEEIAGKTDFDMVWKECAENFRRADWQVLQTRTPLLQYEESRLTADGRKIWLRGSKTPLLDAEGKVQGVLGNYEDITAYRELEKHLRQAQKMEAFGQIAGGVAHDFNNILTVILLQTSLLGKEEMPTKLTQSIQQITHATERAAILTRQLLTFTRQQVFQSVDLNLNEIVESLTTMLERLIGEQVSMETFFVTGGAPIHADRGMLEQVLLNLALNARDAMPKGGKMVLRTEVVDINADTVSKNPKARAGKFVRLCVKDSGDGISAENLPRIFEPFFTTKEVGKGTGLGLATVFGIVQQHQGWIEVESRIGRGTVFYVYLPFRTEKHEEERTWSDVFAMPRGSETILLVEDEETIRFLARSVLQITGYRILEAGDAREALKIWELHKDSIDLLLTDVIMPKKMNGFELAERLRVDKPDLKVIFCSGYSDDVLGEKFALRKNCNFLPKPYSPSKLVQLARDCLDETSGLTIETAAK